MSALSGSHKTQGRGASTRKDEEARDRSEVFQLLLTPAVLEPPPLIPLFVVEKGEPHG